MKIAFVASEIAPLAKTGGLADVAGALPRNLKQLGHDIRLFMPLYSSIGHSGLQSSVVSAAENVPLNLGPHYYEFTLREARLPGSDVPLYLIHCPAVYDRPSIYTNGVDEHLRFLVLQRAIIESCQRLSFAPEIMHCNDWHTALIPLMLKTVYAWDRLFDATRPILSIHNIGYQGIFANSTTYDIGGDLRGQLASDTAAGGSINWLREGVRHAHRVTTVSPTYANEICTPAGGHGLDGDLRARHDQVVGILNGVDYSEWSPTADRYLKHKFSRDDLSGKQKTKRELLDWLNLPVVDATPLMGIVSRLTIQKGFD
jgi:starch synthase